MTVLELSVAPAQGGMHKMSSKRTLLSAEELNQRVEHLPHWKIVEQKKLARTFRFADFQKALDFVNKIGAVAEKQGHHPDLNLSWGKVDVETSTHDAGGLTEQDFLLASKIDQLT
jgi:4a-hydroxytetrahydrobiopterin dehydratase